MTNMTLISSPTEEQVKAALADGGLKNYGLYWLEIDRRVVRVIFGVELGASTYNALYTGNFPHMQRSSATLPYKFKYTHQALGVTSEYWCFVFHWEDESEGAN